MDEIIRVDRISKSFGSVEAVTDASFSISNGEFVSIVGPSGSGKTTILRMIAGFESPSSGKISIKGTVVNRKTPFERDVNMVFQNLALFPHLSVEGNIAYGLRQQGVDRETRRERVDEMLEIVRLEGYNDRSIDELSGGEQQRVALARAIVNEPSVVLFDEPLASLDRKLRQHMQFELQRIQEETGITFLYVTHDQDVALSISDRMIVLNHSEIEQIGPPEELYEHPKTKFVANFIGDLNVLPSTVRKVNGTKAAVADQSGESTFEIDIAETPIETLSQGDSLEVCIRPHHLQLSAEQGNGNGARLEGEVNNIMYKGDSVEVLVETAFGDLLVSIDPEEDSTPFDVTIGDRVAVGVDSSRVHVF